jgi:hypothetical protein
MVEFINEPVSVEAKARHDGVFLPLAFVWRGRRYQIESWGRESAEVREGRSVHRYMVQSTNLETWELCLDTETAQWTLTRHWARKHLAL